MATFFPPRHSYQSSVGPLLAPISAEAFRLWHIVRACTWQKDDAFLARTLDEADKVFAGFFGVSDRTTRRWRTELERCKLLVITTFASGAVSIRCSDPSDLADQQRHSQKVRRLVAYRTFLSNSAGQICPINKEEELNTLASSSSSFSFPFNDQLHDNDQTAYGNAAGQICPIPTPTDRTNSDTPSDKPVQRYPQTSTYPQNIFAVVENNVDNAALTVAIDLLTPLGFYRHVAESIARRLVPLVTPRHLLLICQVVIGECKGQIGLAAYQLRNLHPDVLTQKRYSARARFLEALDEDNHESGAS